MKLMDSFLSSFKKAPSSESKKKSKLSISHVSLASSSSSSYSSSSEEYSATAGSGGAQTTPRSVLRGAEVSLHDLFSVFDCDGDGKITQRELEAVLRRLVPDPPSAEEVASMVADVDRDGDGCISLDEFGAVEAALAGGGGAEELREVFAVFDADGDGKISAEELRGVFAMLGDGGCTLDECRHMISGVDTNGDGFVGFEDFVRMMLDGADRCL